MPQSADEAVQGLRSQFFTGPISERIDLDALDPLRRPATAQIGTIGHYDRQFYERFPWITAENMLPFVVAAGLKWVRTGLTFEDWDWEAGGPTDSLRSWVEADLAVGVKPLFTVNNNANIGTDREVSGAVDLVLGAIAEWGADVGAFMLSNEPGNFIWRKHYGGTYAGGPWVETYARFAEGVAREVKARHPEAFIVNAVQVEQMAMKQFKIAAPQVDALCMHHYTYRHGLPPEFNPRTADPKFTDFATSDPEFERCVSDYLRQGQLLLDNPDLELWMTEVGIPSMSGREYEPDTLEPMSRTQQAKTVARMVTMGLASVTKTFVYCLADQGHDPRRDLDNYGLVADDLTPKPAFFVVGRISAITGGEVSPDPGFLAVPVRMDALTLPMYAKEVARTLVSERLRAERFTTPDGSGLIAIWSTAPPREEFAPRRVTIAVNRPLRGRPILVDPMTGASQFLVTRPGPDGTQTFEVSVPDYPLFILDEQP